jgi:hypothetical protein
MWRTVFAVFLFLLLAACNERQGSNTPGQAEQVMLTSVSVVDAQTGQVLPGLEALSDGATVDLSEFGARSLQLQANTSAADLSEVRMTFGGETYIDTTFPYTFPGSGAGGWHLHEGAHTLSATPYDANGVAGTSFHLSFSVVAPEYERLLYVFRPSRVDIYDINDGHRRVRSLKLPGGIERIWGAVAHAESRRLYISYHGRDDQRRFETGLLAYDLVSEELVWKRLYKPFVDSPAITPDGKTIYLASGEATSKGDFWFVIDTEDGDVKDEIVVHRGAHNTIVGLSGERVYLGGVRYPYLVVADISTNEVIREIGPFSAGVRPFTVNGKETLVFVTLNQHLGFEVGDVATGEKLYTVEVPGYAEPKWKGELHVQSHGIALSPDETEVWVVDGFNRSIHIFDVTGLPANAPRYKESILMPGKSGWMAFSRDGRYAYESMGYVIDTRTRTRVAKTSSSKIRLQIDFLDGVPAEAYARYGLGYITD